MLSYRSFVELFVVLVGGVGVRAVGGGEDVRAREVGVGAHVQIVRLRRIQHKINRFPVRAADRTRGQSAVFVRVVG